MPYPDEFDALPTGNVNDQPNLDAHPALHNNSNGAINRMQEELGLNPAGDAPSVAVRLAARPLTIGEKGGVLDGETDTAAAINETILESSANGGGKVETGFGVGILEAPIEMRAGVHLVGEGEQATVLKGKDGTSHDLIKTLGFDALVGTNDTDGPAFWGVEQLTVDGNAASRSGGRGFAIYGRAFRLKHFIIRNTPGVGLFSEWYDGGDEMEAQISDFKVWNSRGHGVHFRGPHDSVIKDGQVIRAGTGGAPNVRGVWADGNSAAGTLFTNVHPWGQDQARAWYVTANGSHLTGCIGEGASEAQLFLDAHDVGVMGGHYFGVGEPDDTSTALVIGDTASEVYPRRNQVITKLSSAFKTVDFRRQLGCNVYRLMCYPIAASELPGAQLRVGNPADSDSVELIVDLDETYADANYSNRAGPIRHLLPHNGEAVRVYDDSTGGTLIHLDTEGSPSMKLLNGWWVEGASDAGATPTWEIAGDGSAVFTKARPIDLDAGMTLTEGAALAAPAANRVSLYAEDNGAGKTRLMARFATGAAVQVAIQP